MAQIKVKKQIIDKIGKRSARKALEKYAKEFQKKQENQ